MPGLKLDDAYFLTLRDAGFRVGVCVRPQRFTLMADGTARQRFLPVGKVAAELIRKMRYAHDRWGATIFYLDSTVREGGWPLPSEVLEQAARALPDSLLIPEETFPRAYGFSAPFRTFLFHGDTGVPVSGPAVLSRCVRRESGQRCGPGQTGRASYGTCGSRAPRRYPDGPCRLLAPQQRSGDGHLSRGRKALTAVRPRWSQVRTSPAGRTILCRVSQSSPSRDATSFLLYVSEQRSAAWRYEEPLSASEAPCRMYLK